MNLATILLGVFLLILTISFYRSIIKNTLTLKREDRNRILDLLIIGSIIYWMGLMSLPRVNDELSDMQLSLSGTLIFVYGFLILLYKKYKEGYEEGSTKN